MTYEEILHIASTWSFWKGNVLPSVVRNVLLPKVLRPQECLVIQGVRRCGKSTLLRQMIDRYNLDPARCAFVNFEDPRLSNHLSYTTLDALVDAFSANFPDSGNLYFFLDEVQNVADWQRWLRAQLDRAARFVFVVTGSNSAMLSGELGSALTGRHVSVELFPFSFGEFKQARPEGDLLQYLHAGGFPAPLTTPDGDLLRRQYFLDIVERDIRERVGARSSLPVRQVLQMVFESAGSELSMRRIAAAVGIAVETVGAYLDAAEQAYLITSAPYFAYSERKRASYSRKYYPIDPGLRRVAITRTGEDLGKSLEIATAVALRRQFGEVYYWRGAGEVDFVYRDGEKLVPVQVTTGEKLDRHERALAEFWEAFPQASDARYVTVESYPQFFA
jgi:predicted AAA+ superfamily ATPase